MIVYPQGQSGRITLAAGEKIAVFSASPVQIFQYLTPANFPPSLSLIYTTAANESYTSAAFANGAMLVLDPTAAPAYYQVGTAPIVGVPSFDLTAAATPWVLSGLAAAQGGSAELRGGTSSTSGNAGGAAGVTGGQPGATGVGGAASITGGAGGATSGKGGAATVTGGAGTAGNASGGSVLLTPGAKNGSGLDGGVFNRGTFQLRKQAAPVAKSDADGSLTAAQLINGICVHTVTTGRTMTTPTGAALTAALPTDLAVGDAFEFSLISVGTGADDISTLTAGDGDVTFVGQITVGPDTAAISSTGTWCFRYTGGTAFVGYRI